MKCCNNWVNRQLISFTKQPVSTFFPLKRTYSLEIFSYWNPEFFKRKFIHPCNLWDSSWSSGKKSPQILSVSCKVYMMLLWVSNPKLTCFRHGRWKLKPIMSFSPIYLFKIVHTLLMLVIETLLIVLDSFKFVKIKVFCCFGSSVFISEMQTCIWRCKDFSLCYIDSCS